MPTLTKLYKSGSSKVVTIPADWLELMEARGHDVDNELEIEVKRGRKALILLRPKSKS